MASKSGLPSTIIPLTIGATNSGANYTNGGLPLTTLQPGRYLVILNMPIDPINVGANITGTQMLVTGAAVFGAVGAFGLCQLQVSAANAADINSRHSCSNIFTISAATQVFISISATTSAGQWQTSTAFQDGACRSLCFIKLE
jgi:hypothetical protein